MERCWAAKSCTGHPLYKNEQPSSASGSAPVLFVTPVGLPRDALVEWQVALHTGEVRASGGPDQDDKSSDEDEGDSRLATLASAMTPARFEAGSAAGGRVEWRTSAFDREQWGVAGVRELGECQPARFWSDALLTLHSFRPLACRCALGVDTAHGHPFASHGLLAQGIPSAERPGQRAYV